MTAALQAKSNGTQGALLVNGAEVVTFDSTGITAGVNKSAVSQMPTLGTAVATTSGTSIDITGIPSWAKKITVMFDGVSTNGTNALLVQIGAGSVDTSGYLGSSTVHASGSGYQNFTAGFGVFSNTAAGVISGAIVLTLVGGNKWVASGVLGYENTAACVLTGGKKSLSSTLDRLRLTTVGGTDTFDAGSINILYE